MKKILALLCLLIISTGLVNANPIHTPKCHKNPVPQQRMAPPPQPVVFRTPVYVPAYNNGYNYGYNSPSLTFSVGNVDVTLGL